MAHHTNCRPKDNGKKPQKNNSQRYWMRNDFHKPASGTQKNCCRADTDEQTKFGANEGAKIPDAFFITVGGHERDHIHCTEVMQSADGRSDPSLTYFEMLG